MRGTCWAVVTILIAVALCPQAFAQTSSIENALVGLTSLPGPNESGLQDLIPGPGSAELPVSGASFSTGEMLPTTSGTEAAPSNGLYAESGSTESEPDRMDPFGPPDSDVDLVTWGAVKDLYR